MSAAIVTGDGRILYTSCQKCGNELEGKRRCPFCGIPACAKCGATNRKLMRIRGVGLVCDPAFQKCETMKK